MLKCSVYSEESDSKRNFVCRFFFLVLILKMMYALLHCYT